MTRPGAAAAAEEKRAPPVSGAADSDREGGERLPCRDADEGGRDGTPES